MAKQLVPHNKRFTIKKACPYCSADIVAHFEEWEENDDGNYSGVELFAECQSMPTDFKSREWKEWDRSHSVLLYENWHPLMEAIKDKINQQYIFELD